MTIREEQVLRFVAGVVIALAGAAMVLTVWGI